MSFIEIGPRHQWAFFAGLLLGINGLQALHGLNLQRANFDGPDPIRMGRKLKTHVIKKNLNPKWNEELTLSISEPIMPIKLEVYDKDIFTPDDSMGDAELEIGLFVEATKLNFAEVSNDTVLNIFIPNRQNCFAEESRIVWLDGKLVQNMYLRLNNVESGEIELQLEWIYLPGKKPF